MFVQQKKLRINSSFNRELSQQTRTKPVNCRYHRSVKRALIIKPLPANVVRRCLQNQVQLCTQTFAHLIGGAIGKGNGDYLIDVEMGIFPENVKVTLYENGCFTGSWPGRNRDVLLDLVSGRRLLR